MKQQHLLIILGVMALCAAGVLGVLVYQTTHLKIITAVALLPPPESPHVVRSSPIPPSSENTSEENPFKKSPAEVAVTSALVQPIEPEAMKKPFFYAVQTADLSKLNEEQQKVYAGTQEEYIEFYKEWINKWPHDPEAWNKKMNELQQDLAMRIGPEGMDNLLR